MENERDKEEQKNKISIGLILSKDDLNKSIFPSEITQEILDTPYYLLIFISREDVVKISCFPTKTNKIKKVLIKLTEFSPDLVKGISKVLKELNLSRNILHTTGLCYEMERCFYETYLYNDSISADTLKEKFTRIPKVIDVIVEDIPIKK